MMAQACSPSTQEVEAGRLQVPHIPRLHSEFHTTKTLFQIKGER